MERPDSPKKMSSTMWMTLHRSLTFKDSYKIYHLRPETQTKQLQTNVMPRRIGTLQNKQGQKDR